MPTPRYLLIANPGTKRCETYRRELLAFWGERGVMPEVEVIPWADVVPSDWESRRVCRLSTARQLCGWNRRARTSASLGCCWEPARATTRLSRRAIGGLWRFPKVCCCGRGCGIVAFAGCWSACGKPSHARPHLAPTACPLAVAEMFDKTATAVRLRAAEVPVPNWLENPRDVFAEMADSDSGRGWRTVYLKLNTGSSATGIIAIRSEGTQLHGTTTLAEIDGRFFNSRRLLSLTGPALERAASFSSDRRSLRPAGHPDGADRRAELRRAGGMRLRPAGGVDLPTQLGADDQPAPWRPTWQLRSLPSRDPEP